MNLNGVEKMKRHTLFLIPFLLCLLSVWAVSAFAQTGDVPSPVITNANIQAILQSRTARVNLLNQYKASGCLGESNLVQIEILSLEGLSIRERFSVRKLARAENNDRAKMFKEISYC